MKTRKNQGKKFTKVAAVTFSRGLWVETLGLFAIAFLMIYIFLTDANHIMPQIKNSEKTPESSEKNG